MSEKPVSAGKIIGITCGSLFVLFVLIPILVTLANFGVIDIGGLIVPALVIVGIVLLVNRDRKKRYAPGSEYQAPQVVSPASVVETTVLEPVHSSGEFETTVCQHSFSAADLAEKATITCACGFTFKTSDLIAYQNLSDKYLRIERDLRAVRKRLIAASTATAAVTAASTTSSYAAPAPKASPVKAPAPVKQIRKEKKTLSLQQWLIMGASAIIVIAGSIFVSTNLNTLSEYGFLGVTSLVALVTGMLAFWGRKFSVMLANFMATFSSAMLMFAILVTGDISSPTFTWETAPAWFWALDLLVVAVVSFVLARFKANFGWKIISLAAFASSGLVFAIGALGSMFEFRTPSFGWMSASLGLTGILIALASNQVAKLKYSIGKETPDREYELDLSKREDVAIKNFTLLAVSAFAILAAQWPITSGLALGVAPEPVSFTAFALVTVLALVTKPLWSVAVITDGEKSGERVNFWLHLFSFTTVALSLGSWLAFAVGESYWAGLFGTIVLMYVVVGVGFNVKKFSEFSIAIVTAQVALAGSWIIWYVGGPSFADSLLAVSLLLIAFASSMLYQIWLGVAIGTVRVASVLHFVGVALLTVKLLVSGDYAQLSINHALIAFGLIALSAIYAPVTAMLNRTVGDGFDQGSQTLIYIFSTVVAFAITFPSDMAASPEDYFNLAAVTGGSALATGLGSVLLAKKNETIGSLLLRYSYSFQGLVVFGMLATTKSSEDLVYPAVTLVILGAFNYVLGWLGNNKSSVWVSSVLHFVGVTVLAVRTVVSGDNAPMSIEYALVAFGLIVLAVIYGPAIALLTRKLGKEFDFGSQTLVYVFSTVVAFIITLPRDFASTPADYLNLAAVTGGSALVTGLGSALLAKKNQILGSLLLRYSYSFQGIVVIGMLVTSKTSEDLIYPGLTLLLLAALNYTIAWLGNYKPSVWLAYGSSIAGLVLVGISIKEELLISAHLALMIVLSLGLNYVLRLVDKRVAGRYTSYFSLISVFGLTASSFVINLDKWLDGTNSDQILIGLVILVLVAAMAAGAAELKRFGTGTRGIALRVAALAYLLLAFATVASFSLSDELNSTYGSENLVGWRRILVAAVFAVVVFRQSKLESKAKTVNTNAWFALSYLAPVTVALISSQLLRESVDLDKFNLELFTVPLAIALALPSIFNSALPQGLKRLIGMDVPLLFPVAASVIYSLTQDIDDSSTVFRLVASTAILAGYSWFRFSKNESRLWAGLEYAGLLGLGLSLAQLVEVLAPDLLDGPDLFGIGTAAAIVLGNRNLKKVVEFKSSILSHGVPLFALVLPSVIYTYTSLDTSIQLTNPTQIIRMIAILVIALTALLLGIRNGNLGTALAGGASLSLLLVPITWVNAGQSADVENTIALRALGISLFLFLFLGGLRSINKLPESSYIYLGIPSVVALGPSLFITVSSIGNSSLTRVDWWRFGILMAATVTLLVVGALRSLGGLFFPGLVGVLVGVLPYAFQPIARESWFLWVILLLIAGVMVWIAVRLEQLRKLGKSSASWIKSLR